MVFNDFNDNLSMYIINTVPHGKSTLQVYFFSLSGHLATNCSSLVASEKF